ncbi:hypothetical protein D3C77_673460 [compost metagenome]
MTQTPDVLAVDASEQADAAVARRLVVQTELTISDIDKHVLEQIDEHGVGDAFTQHQPHQWAHDPTQRV